ncbi:helix-turn-helix domain-containing protein [Thalassobaculum sp. OXR-137]|uniref:helix-turn-helix domain-containing protein n=1 Tax=Thalassobaculum sp. OXR-137 TaxID=3100173 RepID=UPI002AC8A110|nr:helix-turn-helix domain-containing protein [Thalassobaculum sp. OXR-137]WPZ33790.1 helix-turn-helix domain-containing protein [Thalassobaculum sp. OXR-137]
MAPSEGHPKKDGDPGTDLVPTSLFRIDRNGAKDRLDLWQDSMAMLFETKVDAHTLHHRGFYAEIRSAMLGYCLIGRSRIVQQRWSRTAAQIVRGGLDHYLIQYYESGGGEWEVGRRSGQVVPGDLLVRDLAQESTSNARDFTNFSLVVPRAVLEGLLHAPDDQHMRIIPTRLPLAGLLRDHMISLEKTARMLTFPQALQLAPTTIGLLAACLNGSPGQDVRQRMAVASAQGSAVRRFIEAHLTEPDLSVDWIMARMQISRTRLFDLFEPHGGVESYIRERRLRRALSELLKDSGGDLPILDLALQSGYASDTAFARAFRRRFGISPREARAGYTPSTWRASDQSGPDRRYEDWLSHLTG